jgi:hypothetical protein
MSLAVLSLFYFMTTSVDNPPGPDAAGPSSDAVPNNAEPTALPK